MIERSGDLPELLRTGTELRVTSEGDTISFEGIGRYGARCVGPPGRLHGGLHPIARLFVPAEQLLGRRALGSVDGTLTLRRGIALDEPVGFTGTLRSGDDFVLETRFDDTPRLDGSLRARPDARLLPAEEVARLRALADRSEARRVIPVRGIEFHQAEDVIHCELGPGHTHEDDRDVFRYLEADGSAGAAYLLVALDAVGAISRGMAWDTPVFTVAFAFSFGASWPVPFGTSMRAIVDLAKGGPRPDLGLHPGSPEEGDAYTCDAVVALIPDGADDAIATATVTVHPVDQTRFRAAVK